MKGFEWAFTIFVIGSWRSLCFTLHEPLFIESLQGEWYSWEYGHGVQLNIDDASVHEWGRPAMSVAIRHDIYDYLYQKTSGCFICHRFIIRSWNVIERRDSVCKSLNMTEFDYNGIKKDGCDYFLDFKSRRRKDGVSKDEKWRPQRGHIMYKENPSPINCRHSIYGSFRFAYQIEDSFTGECQDPRSRLHSCDDPGTQFFLSNQKFLLNFKPCEGIKGSFEGSGEFSCLGEWREGLQHYIVATNLRESRKEERYRCFLKNREDPYYMGMSRSPSCRFLRTPDNSPIRLRLEPLQQAVMPTCLFPGNVSGTWVSSGKGEPNVFINSTHFIESRWIGHQLRKDVHVCIQSKGHRYQMAKVSQEGCQTEYVCIELLPRHHNIVRFRKSKSLIRSSYEVCDYGNFGTKRHWKYDTLIADEPNPVECPFSGRFTFGQIGPGQLIPRIVGGITSSPLDTYHCNLRMTDLSICDLSRKNIIIDLDLCQSLNRDGHPTDIHSIPDYHLQCVGFWKEDLTSYLITHDPFDSVSRYKCWIYQRTSLTDIRLSQGLGSSCGLRQTFSSSTFEEGALLALNLTLRERLYDHCPLYYDDGSDPWKPAKETLRVFTFSCATNLLKNVFLVLSLTLTTTVVF